MGHGVGAGGRLAEDLLDELGRRAQGRVLGQQGLDETGQVPRTLRRHQRVHGDGVRRLDGGVLAERRPALQSLVERGAQGPQVGGGAGLGALDALGGDVVDRTDHLAGLGERGGAGGLGDAEVGEDDAPVVAEEDVARLDVAVQHAGRVGGAQGRDHAAPDAGGDLGRDGTALEHVAERRGRHVLHHDAGQAAVVDHIVDDHDVGVGDAGRAAGLPAGALVEGGELVLLQAGGDVEPLDRDLTAEQLVLGPPDGAHAAVTDPLDEPVPPGDQPSRLGQCTLHRARLRFPVVCSMRHPNRLGLRGNLRERPGSPRVPYVRSD